MADKPKRPPIRIRLRFDVETGETEFIIDDDSPDRSDDYHDKVAQPIAAFLRRNPEIEDAGAIRHRIEREWGTNVEEKKRDEKKDEEDADGHAYELGE